MSGYSPFAGDTEAETLSNITMAQFDYEADEFEEISDTAKDFINKLLVKAPKSVFNLSCYLTYEHDIPLDRKCYKTKPYTRVNS